MHNKVQSIKIKATSPSHYAQGLRGTGQEELEL